MAAPGHLFSLQGGIGGFSPRPPLALPERLPPPPWPDTVFSDRPALRAPEERKLLASFVESQVVPRLILTQPKPARTLSRPAEFADSAAAFVPLLLHRNIDDALAFMEAIRNRGQSIDSLYLGLMTQTARYCGRLWDEDLMSAADVSIVAARLHQLLHITGAEAPEKPCGQGPNMQGRDIMLLAQPGAQHMLGLSMVRAFFRKAGWGVSLAAPDTAGELLALMRDTWFAVAGFAITSTDQLGSVRAGIDAVRGASRNHRIGIIVGGPILVEHPEFASQLGADRLALDGEDAVKQAEDLLVVPAQHV
jgi:MerR family transcriptional regulator, light-induced transcriptional regulator